MYDHAALHYWLNKFSGERPAVIVSISDSIQFACTVGRRKVHVYFFLFLDFQST